MVDNLLTFYYVVMKKKIQYNYILELLNELFFLILYLIEISVSTAKLNLFLNDFDIKKIISCKENPIILHQQITIHLPLNIVERCILSLF